jgi:uncharacterized membrane protein YhaH (DUF805 family)
MNAQMFTSLAGRIGRQSWWLGTIVIIVVALILYFILSSILGTGVSAMLADPQKMLEPGFMEGVMRKAAIQQIITLAIIGWPVTALMSQRLNDRDRPSWLKWLFWLPTVISVILGLLGLQYTMTDLGNGVMMPGLTSLGYLVSFASLALAIWMLVECGFLRGTSGNNEHGADPTAG